MDAKTIKIVGIVALVICAVCVFVAVERYNTNADKVKALNSMMGSTPLGGMSPISNIKPTMPAASKYALFFAVISGIGGGYCLYASAQKKEEAPVTNIE